MAPSISKFDTLPFNCYELGHTWNPNCTGAAVDMGAAAFKDALKMYTTCYLVSLIANRRIPKSGADIKKFVTDVLRSSAFLGSHGFLFVVFICRLRQLKGNFNYFTVGLLPSFLACYASIFVEKKQRRPLLALYCTNVATETVYRALRSRGYVRDIKHFEFFLFCFSLITVVYQMKERVKRPDVVDNVLKKIYGPEEFGERPERQEVINGNATEEDGSHGPRRMSLGGPGLRVVTEEEGENNRAQQRTRRRRDDNFTNRLCNFVLWMHKSVEDIASHLERMVTAVYEGQIHEMCPHRQSCFDYWMEGFYSRFLAGFGIHAAFQAISLAKNLLMAPSRKAQMDKKGSLLSNSLLYPCLRSGLGLGVVNLFFRLINCSFRWLKGMDGPGHAAVAAFLSSALGYFFLKPPNSLGLYLFFKAAEGVISESHRKNNWRLINVINKAYGGGWCLLYAISAAILFATAVFEPHNLKPSYYHFLAKSTGGRLYRVNRQLLDIYGAKSSLLMKDFWPKLQEEYISTHMKMLIKMRESIRDNNEAMKELINGFVNVK